MRWLQGPRQGIVVAIDSVETPFFGKTMHWSVPYEGHSVTRKGYHQQAGSGEVQRLGAEGWREGGLPSQSEAASRNRVRALCACKRKVLVLECSRFCLPTKMQC